MSKKSVLSVTEKFKIVFGDGKPLLLQSGFLERGNATIKSGEPTVEVEVPSGDIYIPSVFEAWGRRVINGKPTNSKNIKVEINDPEYNGEIEFLHPSDNNGYMVNCRYMAESSSLDYQFQITRQGLPKKEDKEGYPAISFERGTHEIDPNRNKALALCLKVNPYNASNPLKMPRYTQTSYSEVTQYEVNSNTLFKSDIGFEAIRYVKDAAESYPKLNVLFTILEQDGEIPYDKKNENGKYVALRLLADEQPDKVVALVGEYKTLVNDVIERAKSENILDTTVNGTIKVGKTKKEVLLDGISSEYKDEAMIQYLFDKCLEPNVFDAIQVLKEKVLKNL